MPKVPGKLIFQGFVSEVPGMLFRLTFMPGTLFPAALSLDHIVLPCGVVVVSRWFVVALHGKCKSWSVAGGDVTMYNVRSYALR